MNGKLGQVKSWPPSTGIVAPEIYEAASVHKKTAQFAISYGFPNLFMGR